jgi:transcription initiation factor TFIIF subunit beta
VKVPAFVTRAWRAASDALDEMTELDTGMGGGGGVEIDGGKVDDKELLGKMRMTIDPFAPPEKRQRHFLTLESSVTNAHRIPKEYDMVMTPDDQPIHVFSDVRENTAAAAARNAARAAAEKAAGQQAGAPALPRDEFVLEGAVSEKFDVRPASVTDEAYRATHLRRIEEATKKTRVMGDVKGPQRTVPLPKARNIVQRLDGREDTKEKAERMEKPMLEDRLMGLFERQSLWSFKQLVAETRQPAVWLKECLGELAVLNRRGPNTGQYALKEEYRKR